MTENQAIAVSIFEKHGPTVRISGGVQVDSRETVDAIVAALDAKDSAAACLQVLLNGANERARLLLSSKNRWADRAGELGTMLDNAAAEMEGLRKSR